MSSLILDQAPIWQFIFPLLIQVMQSYGMDLSAGGHLTHGAKVSFSGKLFDSMSYAWIKIQN
jgi:glycine/serine hydroxymethyltransferase